MIGELDIYVATSMRKREDFRVMADFCDTVFRDEKLKDLKLRYFDPTRSAAIGHEDKGLIECLMVKCAKVLVYNAGTSDSFGKDVEAAMALSLGKPVIFFCDVETRRKFYRDVHPLSRLITFENGVAVGAIVTENRLHVVELLSRIFRNDMDLELNKKSSDYFLLSKFRITAPRQPGGEQWWPSKDRNGGCLLWPKKWVAVLWGIVNDKANGRHGGGVPFSPPTICADRL